MSLQNGAGFSGKTIEPAKMERVASVAQNEQLASTPEALLLKRRRTEPSV